MVMLALPRWKLFNSKLMSVSRAEAPARNERVELLLDGLERLPRHSRHYMPEQALDITLKWLSEDERYQGLFAEWPARLEAYRGGQLPEVLERIDLNEVPVMNMEQLWTQIIYAGKLVCVLGHDQEEGNAFIGISAVGFDEPQSTRFIETLIWPHLRKATLLRTIPDFHSPDVSPSTH